jgi:hypothetical protein
MRKIFFDTEFLSAPPELHLISIGMVDEDGREFYGVRKDAPWERIYAHSWLNKNVVPHLPDKTSEFWMSDNDLKYEIERFCGRYPEFWCYVGAYDWTVLTGLYGQFYELPDTWPFHFNDIKWIMAQANVKRLPPRTDGKEHDALADAWEVKVGYDWCKSYL